MSSAPSFAPLFILVCLLLFSIPTSSLESSASADVPSNLRNVADVDTSAGGFVRAADLFRNSLNESIDPCEDFFEFSCGKVGKQVNHPNPADDLGTHGRMIDLAEKITGQMRELFEDPEPSTSRAINLGKQLYRACLNTTESLKKRKSWALMRRMEQFGYWPIIHGHKWRANKFDLAELLANVTRSRAINVLIGITTHPDLKNTSRRLLYFGQDGLTLGAGVRDYYLNDTRYGKQMEEYMRSMTRMISAFARDAGIRRTKSEIAKDVNGIVQFEKNFAKILIPAEERRNFSKIYTIRQFSDMQLIFPELNWTRYLSLLLPEEMRDYVEADPDIVVTGIEFLGRMAKLLRETNRRVIANYVMWRYASAWSLELDTRDRDDDIPQEFLKSLLGKELEDLRRWVCVQSSNSPLQGMPYASGAMFVRKHFDAKSKAAAREMIETIHDAFREMLLSNEWIDRETRNFALQKLEQMLTLIGGPDFLYNNTALDEYYKNVNHSFGFQF